MAGTARLSRDDFVTAALAYVDQHGAPALTARTLGEAMGVDHTALYRHFPGMDELAGAVLDRIFEQIAAVKLPEASARDRLEA
jgi:AcrR family transcriptional regulator